MKEYKLPFKVLFSYNGDYVCVLYMASQGVANGKHYHNRKWVVNIIVYSVCVSGILV